MSSLESNWLLQHAILILTEIRNRGSTSLGEIIRGKILNMLAHTTELCNEVREQFEKEISYS